MITASLFLYRRQLSLTTAQFWFPTRADAEAARAEDIDSGSEPVTDDQFGNEGDVSEVEEIVVPLTADGLLGFALRYAGGEDPL